jgi:hypothetical protein
VGLGQKPKKLGLLGAVPISMALPPVSEEELRYIADYVATARKINAQWIQYGCPKPNTKEYKRLQEEHQGFAEQWAKTWQLVTRDKDITEEKWAYITEAVITARSGASREVLEEVQLHGLTKLVRPDGGLGGPRLERQ